MTFEPIFNAPPERFRKIALEEHFVTPALGRYAHGDELSVAPEPMKYFQKRLLDLDSLRIEEMDRCGIDLSVLSVTTPGVQVEPDASIAVREAKAANDFLAAAIQRHPRRLAGLAHIALQNPGEAATELERAVTQLGFRGALINGHCNGEYLDNDKFSPFLERPSISMYPYTCIRQTRPTCHTCYKGTLRYWGRCGTGNPIPPVKSCGSY